MTERKKNAIVAIISGSVTILSGVVGLLTTVDPSWLPIVVSCVGAITAVIFGVRAKIS